MDWKGKVDDVEGDYKPKIHDLILPFFWALGFVVLCDKTVQICFKVNRFCTKCRMHHTFPQDSFFAVEDCSLVTEIQSHLKGHQCFLLQVFTRGTHVGQLRKTWS